jgi:antitoxin ParD1/3/4
MTSDRVNARLPESLAQHVARVVGPKGLYETPSEYIRSLIRHDMERDVFQIYNSIVEGFEDIAEGRYFESTGNWEKDKEIFKKKEAEGWS